MALNNFSLTSQLSAIRIEAEDMDLSNYRIRSSGFASDRNYIKRRGSAREGIASTSFSGPTGNYDIKINYYDKNTGASQLKVKVGGEVIDTWKLDQDLGASPDFFSSRTIATNIQVKAGEKIEIIGTKNGQEKAAVDFIEFIPTGGSTPAPEPEPSPEPNPGNSLRIEAEDMILKNYRVVSKNFASDGGLIRRRGSATEGSASTFFSGATGNYDINLGYFDQKTGASQLTVKVGGETVDSFTLDQGKRFGGLRASHFIESTIATGIEIQAGEKIEIIGTKDGKEFSAVDYIEFVAADGNSNPEPEPTPTPIPEPTPTPEPLIPPSGGPGLTVDLREGNSEAIKIMPLGDSITNGVEQSEITLETQGGYRDKLWDKFQQAGINVDFVGSIATGPDGFDRDHNGFNGRTIDWLTKDNWSSRGGHSQGLRGTLADEQPDIIVAMAGTNDTYNDTVDKMVADLDKLIEKITRLSPDTKLFVSTIPPIRTDAQSEARAQRAEDFNQKIPDIVNDWASQGRNVFFVDMTNSLTTDDIYSADVDNGLHPTDGGYEKIANLWYDAVVNVIGNNPNPVSNEAVGSNADDTLIGNANNNIITGKAGHDTITGGGGSDTFVYENATDGLDTITDWGNDDIFRISAANFGGTLQPGSNLSNGTPSGTGVFVQGNNPNAIGGSSHFLYDTSNGLLSFDVDGTGSQSAVAIASLEGTPSLSATQLEIV